MMDNYKRVKIIDYNFVIKRAKVYICLQFNNEEYEIYNHFATIDEHYYLTGDKILSVIDDGDLIISRINISEHKSKLSENLRWVELSELGNLGFKEDIMQEKCVDIIKLFCEKLKYYYNEEGNGLFNSLKQQYGNYKLFDYFTRQYMINFYEWQKRTIKNKWIKWVDEYIEREGEYPFVFDAYYDTADIKKLKEERKTLKIFEKEYPKIDYKIKEWWNNYYMIFSPELFGAKSHSMFRIDINKIKLDNIEYD